MISVRPLKLQINNFDPSQPRDEDGKFSETGGGAATVETKKSKKSLKEKLPEMSERQFKKAYEEARAKSSLMADKLIEAGRGQEKPQETLKKDDPLSLEYKKVSEEAQAIFDEMRRREKGHGSLKPLPKHSKY